MVGVLLVLIPTQTKAEGTGLTQTAYKITDYVSADYVAEPCNEPVVTGINQFWYEGDVAGCDFDQVLVRFTGWIFIAADITDLYWFADDGLRVQIDGVTVLNAWWDTPCSGYVIDAPEPGWHQIQVDFYEWGGSTCLGGYQWNGDQWQILDVGVFSPVDPTPTTTTTTSTSTTTSSTTTTTTIPTTTTTTTSTTTSTTSSTTTSTTITPQISTTTTTQPPPPPNTQPIPNTITQLNNITKEEATKLFTQINFDELSDTQTQELINAVQHAPVEIREVFEEEINIYSGNTDTYIPLGSTIPVSGRRMIIITSTLLIALPPVRRQP